VLDIQSELIFVNGMVHLPQEWNFGTTTTLPSPATPLSPLTVTHKAIFLLTWHHTFNIRTYKIMATCIERDTALRANTRIVHVLFSQIHACYYGRQGNPQSIFVTWIADEVLSLTIWHMYVCLV